MKHNTVCPNYVLGQKVVARFSLVTATEARKLTGRCNVQASEEGALQQPLPRHVEHLYLEVKGRKQELAELSVQG